MESPARSETHYYKLCATAPLHRSILHQNGRGSTHSSDSCEHREPAHNGDRRFRRSTRAQRARSGCRASASRRELGEMASRRRSRVRFGDGTDDRRRYRCGRLLGQQLRFVEEFTVGHCTLCRIHAAFGLDTRNSAEHLIRGPSSNRPACDGPDSRLRIACILGHCDGIRCLVSGAGVNPTRGDETVDAVGSNRSRGRRTADRYS